MVKNQSKIKIKLTEGQLVLIVVLLTLFAVIGIYAGTNIRSMQADYVAAQTEYEELREIAFIIQEESYDASEIMVDLIPTCTFSEINPDYIGWLNVERTSIDYPVVQGTDNIQYLDTTFSSEKNPAGTIFMDYRCEDGFDSPLVILYGHNMQDGTMFAELCQSLIRRNITIITKDRKSFIYKIIAVRDTDIYDSIFALIGQDEQVIIEYLNRLNAPDDSNRLLVLSTCTSVGNDDQRLLIIAVNVR